MTKKYNILVIDDDFDDRQILIEALAEIDTNIECHTANDGVDALTLLSDNSLPLPQVIFLDLNMPRLDGKQFLVERSKIARLISIPVVMYSTTKRNEDIEETKKLGAFDFISKPSQYRLICKEVSGALNKIRQTETA